MTESRVPLAHLRECMVSPRGDLLYRFEIDRASGMEILRMNRSSSGAIYSPDEIASHIAQFPMQSVWISKFRNNFYYTVLAAHPTLEKSWTLIPTIPRSGKKTDEEYFNMIDFFYVKPYPPYTSSQEGLERDVKEIQFRILPEVVREIMDQIASAACPMQQGGRGKMRRQRQTRRKRTRRQRQTRRKRTSKSN